MLERDEEDLQDFRSQAHTSYECGIAAHMGHLKSTIDELGQP